MGEFNPSQAQKLPSNTESQLNRQGENIKAIPDTSFNTIKGTGEKAINLVINQAVPAATARLQGLALDASGFLNRQPPKTITINFSPDPDLAGNTSGFAKGIASPINKQASINISPGIYHYVKFNAITYKDATGNTINVPEMVLANAIVTVANQKHMTATTPVMGQDDVFEISARGSYAISLDFQLCNYNKPVDEELYYLTKLYESNAAKVVECRTLNKMGIQYFVMSDIDISQEEGKPYSYRCSLRGYSDTKLDVIGIFSV